ncbi:hypothetical protein [Legionella jordanis]|nr:hypothetical protein [Legionella jordanis]VEH11611.1 Uncharacterised protein [Legionella jordanis]
MKWLRKFKEYYNRSKENRLQILIFFGFVIVPVIGMTILYIWVYLF